MYQRTEIIGIVGKDPVVATAKNGKKTSTFPVAVNRKFGNGEQETAWFRVTVWEKTADFIEKYCQKGTRIFCEGRLACDPVTYGPKVYQRQDGTYAASFDLLASAVKMISNYKSEASDKVLEQAQQKAQQQQTVSTMDDLDIPF